MEVPANKSPNKLHMKNIRFKRNMQDIEIIHIQKGRAQHTVDT